MEAIGIAMNIMGTPTVTIPLGIVTTGTRMDISAMVSAGIAMDRIGMAADSRSRDMDLMTDPGAKSE